MAASVAASNINVSPQFILAGEAIFTVSNQKGEHRTYKVYKSEPTAQYPNPGWFVKVLAGPDNDNDYRYVGMLVDIHNVLGPGVKMTSRSMWDEGTLNVQLVRWALKVIWQTANVAYVLPEGYSIKHEGRCGRCGAKLTNPASLDTGLGPECAEIAGVEWKERSTQQPSLI